MWFWIGLVAGVLPFFLRYTWSSTKEENGQVVAISHFDFASIVGGIVAMACAFGLLSADALSIAKSALLFALALLQLAHGVALGTRLRFYAQRKRQRKLQRDLPDQINFPGIEVGDASDALRMPVGATFKYTRKTQFVGTAQPGEDFLSQVPDYILGVVEQRELFNACEMRLPIMLLAAERGIDRETLYTIYQRMAEVFAEHEDLSPRVPAQTLLNSNALEYVLRRKATPDAILEVFRRFPEIASHREIVRQTASSPLTGEESLTPMRGLQRDPKLHEFHEALRDLLKEQRFGDVNEHADIAVELAAKTHAYEHALILSDCGMVLFQRRQLMDAEPILRKAARLAQLALEQQLDDSPELFEAYLKSEYSLAEIYLGLGDYQQAIDHVQKGTARFRNLIFQVRELDDMGKRFQPLAMYGLEISARVYFSIGHNTIAQSLARAALYQAWDLHGEEHPYPSRVQILLATIYRGYGLHELSRKHFENALPHAELDPSVQLQWASHLIFDGEFDRAKQLLQEATDSAVFHANMQMRADRAAMLGEIAVGESSFKDALSWKMEAVELSDRFLNEQSARLSSQQLREHSAAQFRYVYEFVDFVLRYMPDQPDAVRAACDAVLRRKLIESDALRHIHYVASTDPKLREHYQRLRRLRSRIGAARLIEYAALKYDANLAEGVAKRERLEADIAAAVGGFRIPKTDSREIESKLPQDTALVEYLCLPWIPATPGDDEKKPTLYYALVIQRGRPCELVKIGTAESIDSAIAEYQREMTRSGRHLVDQDEGDVVRGSGERVRQMIFDPIKEKIRGCSGLVIAPDGELCRVPIGALPSGDDYLINKYRITYVSTGRDMLRDERERGAKHGLPTVMADPDYDLGKGMHTYQIFKRLEGARDEGLDIAQLLGVDALVDADATEETLKELKSPVILHIATHAYFQDKSSNPTPRGTDLPSEDAVKAGLSGGGLALAGVNVWLTNRTGQGANEGLVNAEDVLEIDLSGTQLTVLSACETALGDVRIGQGVMGLRRSFVVAGTDTLVMSLWRVPDKETAELMKSFYREILRGEGCGDALCSAQRELLHRDPYYWGAFICQGNSGPISSEVIAEIRQRVADRSGIS